METVENTVRAMTSKPVQRAAVNVVLLVSGVAALLGLASLATIIFFKNFVPDQFITKPVFLQYQPASNPYGIVQLTHPLPKLQQDYDVSVTLSMPRSPPNLVRGNFMVSLYLVKDNGKSYETATVGQQTVTAQQHLANQKVLFKSRRPALLPYEDRVVSVARRVFFLGFHILFPYRQGHTMTIQLAERVKFDKGSVQPTAAFVEIEAGPAIQIYQTSLTLTAQLQGLRWLMFHYRIVTYIAFTLLFWVCEVVFMCLAWALWSSFSAPDKKVLKGADFDDDYDDDDFEGQSVRTRQASVKSEASVKLEEEDEQERTASEIPVGGTEADDEYEYDDEDNESSSMRRDAGAGTSYRGEGSERVRRRRHSRFAAE